MHNDNRATGTKALALDDIKSVENTRKGTMAGTATRAAGLKAGAEAGQPGVNLIAVKSGQAGGQARQERATSETRSIHVFKHGSTKPSMTLTARFFERWRIFFPARNVPGSTLNSVAAGLLRDMVASDYPTLDFGWKPEGESSITFYINDVNGEVLHNRGRWNKPPHLHNYYDLVLEGHDRKLRAQGTPVTDMLRATPAGAGVGGVKRGREGDAAQQTCTAKIPAAADAAARVPPPAPLQPRNADKVKPLYTCADSETDEEEVSTDEEEDSSDEEEDSSDEEE